MKEKLKDCFDRLQSLNIQPTLNNLELLLQSLYDIREVYQQLDGKDGDGNGVEC